MSSVLGKNLSAVLTTYGARERERHHREAYDIVHYDLPDGRKATVKEIKSGTELTYLDIHAGNGLSSESVTFRDGRATWHDTYEYRTSAQAKAANAPRLAVHVESYDENHDGKPDGVRTTHYDSWKQLRVRTEIDTDGDGTLDDIFEETQPVKLVLAVNGKKLP